MKKIYGIHVELIDTFNEAARSTYPDEFLSMLRADDGVISELIFVPGTVYGESHSFMREWMAPVDFSLIGTVHSHPSYSNQPSGADLQYFANYGGVHVITCMPFDRNSWKAYNSSGEILDLELITDS